MALMSFLLAALLTAPVVVFGRHTTRQRKPFIGIVVGCALVFVLERLRFHNAYPKWEGGEEAVVALSSGKATVPPPPWLLEKSGVRCIRDERMDKSLDILCEG